MFSLFSNRLSEDEKSRMAANLLTQERPIHYKLKKPDFPNLSATTTLTSLVGPLSWALFDEILQVDTNWLYLPPSDWDSNSSYCEARDFVRHLKVFFAKLKNILQFIILMVI